MKCQGRAKGNEVGSGKVGGEKRCRKRGFEQDETEGRKERKDWLTMERTMGEKAQKK